MNVGDYCYIKGISRDYGIGIITQLNSGYSSRGGELIDIQFKHSKHSVPKIDVVSSPNIIDLLKKDDLVVDYNDNIYKVNKIYKGYVFTDKKNKYGQVITLVDYQIKSIITKEQFSSMQYKVGD